MLHYNKRTQFSCRKLQSLNISSVMEEKLFDHPPRRRLHSSETIKSWVYHVTNRRERKHDNSVQVAALLTYFCCDHHVCPNKDIVGNQRRSAPGVRLRTVTWLSPDETDERGFEPFVLHYSNTQNWMSISRWNGFHRGREPVCLKHKTWTWRILTLKTSQDQNQNHSDLIWVPAFLWIGCQLLKDMKFEDTHTSKWTLQFLIYV